jgi:ribose transport system permease protein
MADAIVAGGEEAKGGDVVNALPGADRLSIQRDSWVDRVRHRVLRIDEIGVLGALFLMSVLLAVTTDDKFLQLGNLLSVSRQASIYGIMAVGMVFVMSLGEIDLSIGSIVTLVNVVAALALQDGYAWPIAVAAGLLTGAACGLANGALSVVLRIPTIIVTLGTLSIYRGISLVLSNAAPVSNYSKDNWFFNVLGGNILGVPAGVWGMVGVCLLGVVLYYHTVFGRRVQAIGGNRQAARFSGLPITRYRIVVMTLMGFIAGLAGVFALAFLRAGDPQTGPGLELFVIAATIIGGTSFTGGSGSIVGACIGALIIAVIRNGLVLLGVTPYWGTAATGAVIIAAVTLDYLIKRR